MPEIFFAEYLVDPVQKILWAIAENVIHLLLCFKDIMHIIARKSLDISRLDALADRVHLILLDSLRNIHNLNHTFYPFIYVKIVTLSRIFPLGIFYEIIHKLSRVFCAFLLQKYKFVYI